MGGRGFIAVGLINLQIALILRSGGSWEVTIVMFWLVRLDYFPADCSLQAKQQSINSLKCEEQLVQHVAPTFTCKGTRLMEWISISM